MHIEHNGKVTNDNNGVYLNSNGTLVLQCVSNATLIQWTSSVDDGFLSTSTTITVDAVATYTCVTVNECEPTAASINVQGMYLVYWLC